MCTNLGGGNWGACGHHPEGGPCLRTQAHIVLMEEGQVADDADPDKQRGGAQQDAADVVAGQVLGTRTVSTPSGWGVWPRVGLSGGQYRDQGLEGAARAGPTLASMPIFMMVPEMVSTSLVTSRMYQPLTNSSRSHRLMARPRCCHMNRTNSCGRQAE